MSDEFEITPPISDVPLPDDKTPEPDVAKLDVDPVIESLKDEQREELDDILSAEESDLYFDSEPFDQESSDTSEAESSLWLQQPLLTAATLDWEKMIWATILILTIVTRFWGLGDRVVSHDESLHTHYSFQYYNGDGYSHTPLMHGPFLFHVTAFSYWMFGANDFTARIPVAIFGVLLVFIPWFMRSWIGRTGAIFAGIILLISPYSLYYSRYIRHDVYVIVWALIIMVGMFHYFRHRDDRSIYWIAAGLALMFATKEVAFIYAAIFGGFIVLRLLFKIGSADWFLKTIFSISFPTVLLVGGVVLFSGAFVLDHWPEPEVVASITDGAEEILTEEVLVEESNLFGLLQIFGLIILSGGLFFLADKLKSKLSEFAEFDLVVLLTTLILPLMTPLLVNFTGKNPQDYLLNRCAVPNADVLNPFSEFTYRMGDAACRQLYFASPIVTTTLLMVLMLGISIYVGLWWSSRRWIPAAIIYHLIFAILYTSVFSNPWGWMTGAVGSLGYWLEQQEVARGGQPWFYYLFVTPFYEFLPLVFSLAAIRLWTRQNGLGAASRFWGWVVLASGMAMGLVNWYYNGINGFVGDSFTRFPGLIVVVAILAVSGVAWLIFGDMFGRANKTTDVPPSRLSIDDWFGFFPFSVFWLIATVVAYTIAGEKMPWLSIHIVIPMAFLVGWYFNELFKDFDLAEFMAEKTLIFFGLVTLLIITAVLLIGPVFIGDIRFGDQSQAGLNSVGRFMGLAVFTGFIGWLLYRLVDDVPRHMRRLTWTFSTFALLGLLTIRFAWMAAFPNADYTTEYLVYAHGGPSTSQAVIPQLEELSKRLYGDMSLKVYYDNEASWPFTWYLRDFDDRVYFGENPSPDIKNADAILVGDANYSKVEPYLGDDFESMEFTFLWWPMEEYRQISWESVLGNPVIDGDPSLLNSPEKRQGLWDIFFYRDYSAYGTAVGKTYQAGSWPLKRNMRLYIRREALGTLWDKGVGATVIQAPVDPYAAGELPFAPNLVAGQGILTRPRNVAVAADGSIFVADSGNHRIQVFDPAGAPLFAFGQNGVGEGEFNEPWGIAIDEEFVYVTDTWNNRIQKFTLEGDFVLAFGISGSPESPTEGGGQFYGPRDVVLGPNDTLMVTDTGNHRIQLFNRSGQFLSAIGGQGVRGGEFFEPVGLAVASDGTVFVSDTWNNRVQELIIADQQLFPVNDWDVDAWDKSQSIDNKPYLAVDPSGNVFITDPEGYRVIYFDRGGNYVGRFGTFTSGTDGFGLPNGIATDSSGQIYVTDATIGVVYRFDAVSE
ncbi:MAG: sugar lactone lactonase YvrE [Cellvibrionaceae bacterium]|jgi:sugar lactone lactonase YvrE